MSHMDSIDSLRKKAKIKKSTLRKKDRDKNCNVSVIVRVRPFLPSLGDKELVVKKQNSTVSIEKDKYTFDSIYDGKDTNTAIYENSICPLLGDIHSGYNCSIFAYGQTCSGKTITMLGMENDPGIIHRLLRDLLLDKDATLEISFIEVYCEKIYDLLSGKENLKIRESLKKKVYIENLTSYKIKTEKDLDSILEIGKTHRHTSATMMNERSSRSHAILQVQFRKRVGNEDTGYLIRRSEINLVDLAGSERLKRSMTTGQTMVESIEINKSLSTLNLVISQLSGKKENSVVNFRDSTLTRILSNGLGGNSKTVMIANISPDISSISETRSTLEYAKRAKKIVNKVKANYECEESNQISIMEVMHEIQKTNPLNEEELEKLKSELEFRKREYEATLEAEHLRVEEIQRKMEAENLRFQEMKRELEEEHQRAEETEKELVRCEEELQKKTKDILIKEEELLKLKEKEEKRMDELNKISRRATIAEHEVNRLHEELKKRKEIEKELEDIKKLVSKTPSPPVHIHVSNQFDKTPPKNPLLQSFSSSSHISPFDLEYVIISGKIGSRWIPGKLHLFDSNDNVITIQVNPREISLYYNHLIKWTLLTNGQDFNLFIKLLLTEKVIQFIACVARKDFPRFIPIPFTVNRIENSLHPTLKYKYKSR